MWEDTIGYSININYPFTHIHIYIERERRNGMSISIISLILLVGTIVIIIWNIWPHLWVAVLIISSSLNTFFSLSTALNVSGIVVIIILISKGDLLINIFINLILELMKLLYFNVLRKKRWYLCIQQYKETLPFLSFSSIYGWAVELSQWNQ